MNASGAQFGGFVEAHQLSPYDAGVLSAERATADFFEEAVGHGAEPKRVCNLLTQVGLKLAHERDRGLVELGLTSRAVADLALMVTRGEVSASAGNTLLEHMVTSGKRPEVLAAELQLLQKSDSAELEIIVDKILREQDKAVAEVRAGGKKAKKAQGFLLGQVMQKSGGQANPKVVSELLAKKLS